MLTTNDRLYLFKTLPDTVLRDEFGDAAVNKAITVTKRYAETNPKAKEETIERYLRAMCKQYFEKPPKPPLSDIVI
jgi:hypothetical protein